MSNQSFTTLLQQHQSKLTAAGAVIIAAYLAVVRQQRYKYINEIRQKYPDPDFLLKDMHAALTVSNITLRKEFAYFSRQALELALFKTYAVPSISKLLIATKEISHHTKKRVEDTEAILTEIADPLARIENERLKNPNLTQKEIESQVERAYKAFRRLNEIHGKYNIANEDFLYTLSLFMIEPVEWFNRYEWRQLDQREINALFHIWYDFGVRMNLKDIPESYEKMVEFKEKFEREHVRYSPSNWKCAEPTVLLILTRFPKIVWPLFYKVLPSVIGQRDAAAFGLPPESRWMTWLITKALRLRAFFIRHAFLPRRRFVVYTSYETTPDGRYKRPRTFYDTVYPDGYRIEELGPQKFCPVPHT